MSRQYVPPIPRHQTESLPVIEQIVGPVHGYYLACYTLEHAGGFYGYAKICLDPVTDIWNTKAERKLSAGPCISELDAMNAVLHGARTRLREREIAFGKTWRLDGSSI